MRGVGRIGIGMSDPLRADHLDGRGVAEGEGGEITGAQGQASDTTSLRQALGTSHFLHASQSGS